MFNFLKRKNKLEEQEKEFSFIWCNKMCNGETTYYNAPVRTKITAKNKEQAIDQLVDFLITEMKVVIFEEKDFPNSELSKMSIHENVPKF